MTSAECHPGVLSESLQMHRQTRNVILERDIGKVKKLSDWRSTRDLQGTAIGWSTVTTSKRELVETTQHQATEYSLH